MSYWFDSLIENGFDVATLVYIAVLTTIYHYLLRWYIKLKYDNKYRINVYTRSTCPIYDIEQVRITQSYFAKLEGDSLTIVSPKI